MSSMPMRDSGPSAFAQEVTIVRSSYGRLRVHLPDPDGRIAAGLRQFPGVTSAEANERTGNILILYDPRWTSEAALLAELRAAGGRAPSQPAPVPAPVEESDHLDQPGIYVTGARGRLYKALGWSSVGLAVVGAATPAIPTVPFALLAGYFFVRSSPKAHAWLLRSRWLGPSLRDWEEHQGVRRSVKYAAVGLMTAGLGVTVALGLPVPVVASIAALEVVGLVVVLRLPVVEPGLPAPMTAPGARK